MSDSYNYANVSNQPPDQTPDQTLDMPGQSVGRDRITQALMRIQNPPPGGPLGQQMAGPTGGMPPQPSPTPLPMPGGVGMPQIQPASIGAIGPPMAPMGPVGGAYQPGLNLPGITPPGMLPQRR
jgi:hypothetical protein